MATRSIIDSMHTRDPFLRDNLHRVKYRENIHKAYLELSQTISELLRPPTPEEIEEPKVRRHSKVKSGRKSRQSRKSNWSATSSILAKYRLQAPSIRAPSRTVRSPKPQNKKSKPAKTPEPREPSCEPDRVRYTIKYSKALDNFKRKIYRDLIAELGLDINQFDDPSTVEIDLAWCKPGAFNVSRESTYLSLKQIADDTMSIFSDRDDCMSVYSSYSHLPSIARSVRSPRGSTRGHRSPERAERKGKTYLDVDDNRHSKLPKLPAIGEH